MWVTGGSRRRVKENPPMRIYISGNEGIALCREAPATVNDGEIAVRHKRNCMQRRSAASGCWPCGTLCPVSKSGGKLATARH